MTNQQTSARQPASDLLTPLLLALHQQQVIAYPTEAVFGLGCDPDSDIAIRRLLALKQRRWQKGLILVAASYEQLQPYIDHSLLTPVQRQAVFACWPGPVTFVFPSMPHISPLLTGEHHSLAVRVSAHPSVIALCQAFGKPLVSTSANLAGQPPCRSAAQVIAQFGAQFPLLNAATGGRQQPSAIRDALTGQCLRIG